LLGLAAALAMPVQAQQALPFHVREYVFRPGVEFGVGARAMGMGGAFMAVGDDYTSSYWNPAALAQIRRFEVLAALSHDQHENDASGVGFRLKDEGSFTRLNSIGFAYPVPTYRGSLVFSVGYNRIKPYDSSFNFAWYNSTANDSVEQSWSEIEEGSLDNWTFAGAVDVAPNFSVGVALNYWSGKDDYQFSFVEQDKFDYYNVPPTDFLEYRLDDNVISEFRGFNLKLGGLYRLNSNLRLAATVATPTTLTVRDDFLTQQESRFDDGTIEPYEDDEGGSEYKIRSPFVFGAGASLSFANLLVTGSAEFIDWSQIRYSSKSPIKRFSMVETDEPKIEKLSKLEANRRIARNYRNATRLRAGAEFTVPGLGLQVRGGYYLDPSPLKNLPDDADREFLTYGLGFLLNKQVKLDVAYFTGKYNVYNARSDDFTEDPVYVDRDDDILVNEKVSVNRIVATLAFRL
jgi:long-subunit fatty acid transport protein